MAPPFENKILKRIIKFGPLGNEVNYIKIPFLPHLKKKGEKSTNNKIYINTEEKLKLLKSIKFPSLNKTNNIPNNNHNSKKSGSITPQVYSCYEKNNFSFQKTVKINDKPLNPNFDDYNNRGDDMDNLNDTSIRNFILNKTNNRLLQLKYNNKYLKRIKLMSSFDNKIIMNRKFFQRNKLNSTKNKFIKSEIFRQYTKIYSYKNFYTEEKI